MGSVALVVLDGWGLAPPGPANAVSLARTPAMDQLWSSYPHTELHTDGGNVGLPEGQMGNSEVGHLNLGAGAIVKQDLQLIDDAIKDGSFGSTDALVSACRRAKDRTGRIHLIGLVSDGGVHSSLSHLKALIELVSGEGVPECIVHAITDGRDTSPTSGVEFVGTVASWLKEAEIAGVKSASIGTVVGRYYAMDRDNRWDRTKAAYDAMVHGVGRRCSDAVRAVEDSYREGTTDEFILPTVIGGAPRIEPGDSVVHFNFRPDRGRELVRALAEPGFDEFDREGAEPFDVTTMTQFKKGWPYPQAFPPHQPEEYLARAVSATGGRQLHVAETEKYAHVTYFFGGGREEPEIGEDRLLVPSPRDVATYDLKPEMSARGVAKEFTGAWRKTDYRFGIVNFANADMVGHTGDIPAAVKAIETVDSCLGEVVTVVHERGGAVLVTADHGNADRMIAADGTPDTAHTMNPVPAIVTVSGIELRSDGVLADVAPTVLDLLGIEIPAGMTRSSLMA